MKVILGLGSNVGDRLAHLRKTLHAISQIENVTVLQVSPVYISDAMLPENAPADWDMDYLNLALSIETKLNPFTLHNELKKVEYAIGKKPDKRHWGPRIIDIDILSWEEEIVATEDLMIPRDNMLDRPFQLWPLADLEPRWIYPLPGATQGKTAAELVEAWGSRFTGQAPFRTRQIYQRIDTPQLVGIVNITPDSYSDGGRFLAVDAAIQQIQHLVSTGAEIIDIGAESTSPTAKAITAEMEWSRLEPVLASLQSVAATCLIPPKFSLDTRHADIAKKALAYGIDWINDVSGLDDPAMRRVIADAGVDCVVMHHICIPENRQRVLSRQEDPVQAVLQWGNVRLQELSQAGIKREKVIFDPGIGFGKLAEQSLEVLRGVNQFQQLGTRILLGHSRKTFMSLLTDYPFAQRDVETLGIALKIMDSGIDYLRVHHTEMMARGFRAYRM